MKMSTATWGSRRWDCWPAYLQDRVPSRQGLPILAIVRARNTISPIHFCLSNPLYLEGDLMNNNKRHSSILCGCMCSILTQITESLVSLWKREADPPTHSAPSSSSQFPKQGPPPSREPITRSFFSTRIPRRSPRLPPTSSAPSKAPIRSSFSCHSSSPSALPTPNVVAIWSDPKAEDCGCPAASPEPLLSTITSEEQ